MNDQKYLELAKKLAALAGGGVAGEKLNAQKALDAVMAKYGITKAQLEESTLDWLEFSRPTGYIKLFHQVAMTVIGNRGTMYREHRTNRKAVFLEVTPAEKIEIQGKFDFYLTAFMAEEETLLGAFIMRNNLYNIDSKGKTMEELSMEELAAIAKAANLARGMDAHHYHKALTAPEN